MTDLLSALRDVPTLLTPERAEAARLRTHERLGAAMAPRRRRLGARRPLALALTGVAAAGVLVLTTGGGSGEPAVATAATVLHHLGRRAGDLPPLRLAAGEYYAVRVHQYPAAGPGADVDMRTWAAGDQGRKLTIVNGKTYGDVALGAPDPDVPSQGAVQLPDLSTFPTDPAALAVRMREAARSVEMNRNAAPTTHDYVLAAAQMIWDRPRTPPAVLRGIYDFLAGQPGIKLVGDVKDPLGRPGQAVAADGDEAEEGIGAELIVAPDTGLPLALVHYRDGDVNRPWLYTTRQEGVVSGTDALPGGA
jgi:hypothetical protein